jgi:flagellar protein FliO/FliZ
VTARSPWTRLLAEPRGRAALLAAGAGAALLVALSPGELGPVAARAALAVGGLAALAVLARRGLRRPAPAGALAVVASRALSRDAGVALVELEGRRILIGFGASGVHLLADLPPLPGSRP